MKKNIRVVTRASSLALAQTNQVVALLAHMNPEYNFEIIKVKTTGDRVTDRPLSSFCGTGVFVKELQNTLLNKKAELAVHSLKDVPIQQPEELVLVSYPERADVRDVLLGRYGDNFNDLKKGALIGTSSPRRFVQLQSARKDLQFSDLRGNLDTRIRKLGEGQYDGIVLAAAGMKRLSINFPENSPLPFDICLPAVGQGAVTLECRKDDIETTQIAEKVNHRNTMIEVTAERNFLSTLGGGCSMPIAALARKINDTLLIEAMVGDPETFRIIRRKRSVDVKEYKTAGRELGHQMLELCDKENIKLLA